MIIKNKQFDVFSGLNKMLFIEKLIILLREEFEEANEVADDDFINIIQNQIEQAMKYNIIIEKNIAKFVITAFLLGENFDINFKGAKNILENGKTYEDEKIISLEEWTLKIFETLEN